MTLAELRGASAEALEELTRAASTHASGEASAVGEELFGVAGVLRAEPALRRVLTDSSVEGDRKVGLVRAVFGSSLREDTLGLVTDAVGRRWTASNDLPDALAEVAAVSVVRSAGDEGGAVSDQLFAVRQLVNAQPELRSALSDQTRPTADRAALLTGILGNQVHPATARLVEQAVRDEGSVDAALDRYQKLAAQVQGAVVAVVHTARSLSDGDRSRLVGALGQQYGATVQLHEVVDPGLIGGLRVEIGDDVIDGTVANRLDEARRLLAG